MYPVIVEFPRHITLKLLATAFSALVTYFALVGLCNSTEFRINDTAVTVRNYPLPCPGGKSIPSLDIDRLYCLEVFEYRSKNTYCVNFLTKKRQAPYAGRPVGAAEPRVIHRATDRTSPGHRRPPGSGGDQAGALVGHLSWVATLRLTRKTGTGSGVPRVPKNGKVAWVRDGFHGSLPNRKKGDIRACPRFSHQPQCCYP